VVINYNTLGPRLTVRVRDERMDMLDDRGCNGRCCARKWGSAILASLCLWCGLPSQKGPGCFVAGAGDGDGDAISEVKTCRL